MTAVEEAVEALLATRELAPGEAREAEEAASPALVKTVEESSKLEARPWMVAKMESNGCRSQCSQYPKHNRLTMRRGRHRRRNRLKGTHSSPCSRQLLVARVVGVARVVRASKGAIEQVTTGVELVVKGAVAMEELPAP